VPNLRAVGDGFLEEEVGGGREDAAATEFEIDESAGGELDVADGFGRDAEAGAAGEQAVFGVLFAKDRFVL